MPNLLRIAYFVHTLRSDWNNGNAHFLRGLLRALGNLGYNVTAFEPVSEWSVENLRHEALFEASIHQFNQTYPDLHVQTYTPETDFRDALSDFDIVILHEWNSPELAHMLTSLRHQLRFKLLFHDTHHRASSSPSSFADFNLDQFDGILAFGESLRTIYQDRFGLERVWTLHEAADVSVFHPLPAIARTSRGVWIGNWGEGERSHEIAEYFLKPAARLREEASFLVHGVRYPSNGLTALAQAGVEYGGYLPNLSAPDVYARAAFTVHIPRQQYTSAMPGIPTIRVFEALACGIPLISAPWRDTEQLFRNDDFVWVTDAREMTQAMRTILHDREAADDQAKRGMQTVLARHTCAHRAIQLAGICQELSA